MKIPLLKSYGWGLLAMLPALMAAFLLVSCKDEEPMKWVDLRYKAEDAYTLEATSPAPIRMQVKSTDPWRVYGRHNDWCTITPSEGLADEISDVEVQYNDNTGLDDRIDTIIIQSDYWIGKWVQVMQKGTAYLNLEGAGGIELPKNGGSGSFRVLSNQDWSVLPDKDASWLNLASVEGSGDGDVSFSAENNYGEQRYARLSVCDRHDKVAYVVTVTQAGIRLDPSELLVKTDHKAKTYGIDVVSTTSWIVADVEFEEDVDPWFTISETSYSGSGRLEMSIEENSASKIRNAKVTLRTVAGEGEAVIEKIITVRQAYPVSSEKYEFNDAEKAKWSVNQGTAVFADGDVTFSPGRLLRSGFVTGNYTFRIASCTADAMPQIYFVNDDWNFEIRWWLNCRTGMTEVSVRNAGASLKYNNVSFDPNIPHEIGLRMAETSDGYTRFEWILDGKMFNSYTCDGTDGGKYAMKYNSRYSMFLGCSSGTVTYDWWDYSTYFDWGD